MTNPDDYDPPLAGVRILDLSRGPMTAVGRLLADLGAAVTQVHLPGVTAEPDDRLAAGAGVDPDSVGAAINRHGVSTVGIDLSIPDDRRRWVHLLAGADILIEDTPPGSAAEKALAARNIHA